MVDTHSQEDREPGSLFSLTRLCAPCLSDSISLKLNFAQTLRTVCTVFIYIRYAYYSNLNFSKLFHTDGNKTVHRDTTMAITNKMHYIH
jgi:hypothetical protein